MDEGSAPAEQRSVGCADRGIGEAFGVGGIGVRGSESEQRVRGKSRESRPAVNRF